MVRFHFASHSLVQYDLPLCVIEQREDICFKFETTKVQKHSANKQLNVFKRQYQYTQGRSVDNN